MTKSDLSRSMSRLRPFKDVQPMGKEGFSAASLSLRAQKKLASRFVTRGSVRLVSPAAARLLDRFYEVLERHYTKKVAEKTTKNIVKIIVKLALVAKSGSLAEHEQGLLRSATQQLHTLSLTIASFYRLTGSYEPLFMEKLVREVKKALEPVVGLHLSDKSEKRLAQIFETLEDPEFYHALFSTRGALYDALPGIVDELEAMVEQKEI
ncbi:unnamed protein product, partial [Mesorhabditis spiculigera]